MTQGLFDPLALWRDMLTKWQAAFGETAGAALGPAEMTRFVNQSMVMSMQMQQTIAMMMGKYLATLNIPTRADLAAMEARLERIEEQLARLTRQGADAADKPVAPTLRAEAETPRAKRAAPARQSVASRAAVAERTAAQPVAAQPARAAKAARRTAKKQTQAAS
jgi:hypothetical protein